MSGIVKLFHNPECRKSRAVLNLLKENKELTRSELIEIIIKNPILLERPIVIANNKAVVGRPPVSVLEIV